MIQAQLTQEQYDACSKIYGTYNIGKRRAAEPFRKVKINGEEFLCGPPPNYIMGDSLTIAEIKKINSAIDKLLIKINKEQLLQFDNVLKGTLQVPKCEKKPSSVESTN